MTYLDELENNSIYIIREAYNRFKNIALLWSIGKDSTSMLWIAYKAFFGKIPFPVIHIDTTFKFKEIYEFRDTYARRWGLNLIIAKNENAIKEQMRPEKGRFKCCNALKTEALKLYLKKYGFKALVLGIRRDEHGIRAKERYFSPRGSDFKWDYLNQPAEVWDFHQSKLADEEHIRIHPLLQWKEIDIWNYIKKEKIPFVGLYTAKNKLRYRSIGCHPCCSPIKSDADNITKIIKELEILKTSERSGRAQDKEGAYAMQKLRSLGYM